jgi:hypothetical protein
LAAICKKEGTRWKLNTCGEFCSFLFMRWCPSR